MSKILIIDSCAECRYCYQSEEGKIWGTYHCSLILSKDMNDINIIQEWCPLPDDDDKIETK